MVVGDFLLGPRAAGRRRNDPGPRYTAPCPAREAAGACVTGRKAGLPLLPLTVLEVAFEPAGLHRQPGPRSSGSVPLTCLRAVTGAAGQQRHLTA